MMWRVALARWLLRGSKFILVPREEVQAVDLLCSQLMGETLTITERQQIDQLTTLARRLGRPDGER